MIQNSKFKIQNFSLMISLFFGLLVYGHVAMAGGPYTDSAHGNTGYGVLRTSLSTAPNDYAKGNCAHCHEQHASIGGTAPAPDGTTASIYCLFYNNYVSQTDDFCFYCHTDSSSYQSGGLVNRSYSYRAGGYTSDSLNDILEAFSFTSPGSSHNLGDIRTFITGNWNYTADSNPCAACHNPHMAKGDPANAGGATKSSGTRGWPVSRPSQHSKDNNAWGLWGDNATTERMSKYTTYQAPYRVGSTTYEPDGTTTQDGSNLTDYVTFCQDCHSTLTGYGLTHSPIYWTTGDKDKHGACDADGSIDIKAPYSSTVGKVLSCTDCHEPHGAPNVMLIRKEVNGAVLFAGTITTIEKSTTQAPGGSSDNTDLGYLCHRCHYGDNTKADNCYIHHTSSDAPYPGPSGNCKKCHYDHSSGSKCTSPVTTICCNNCHFHGSTDSWAAITGYATGRRTF